jgi:hypothetical protein
MLQGHEEIRIARQHRTHVRLGVNLGFEPAGEASVTFFS